MNTVTLYEHQQKAVDQGLPILKMYGILCLSMEVRTGKTFTSLAIAEKYGAKNVLFVTKKKAINSIVSDYNTLSPSYGIKVINFESLHKIHYLSVFDIVIIDESHSLGAFPKPSQRAKNLKKICVKKPIIFLSGTFSPESYCQLFHQFWVSSFSPWKSHRNFYEWAKAGYVNITQKFYGPHPTNDYSKANEDKIWQDVERYFLSVSQKEANFDGEINEKVLYVDMNDTQKTMLRSLKYEGFCKHPSFELYAIKKNGADLINKMCQVSSGTLIYDDEQKGRVISANKAKFIRNYFKGQKIAILYKYKAEFEVLKHFYPLLTDDPEVFKKIKNSTFVAQIKSAQEGVDLSLADSLVMYNIDFSATSYFQARARTQNKKRTKPANVYWIFSNGGIEMKIYNAVKSKKRFTYSYYQKNNL